MLFSIDSHHLYSSKLHLPLPPPPPPSCLPSTLVSTNHAMFIFWILYLSSLNTGTCMYFLKFQMSPTLFQSSIRNPILTPHPVVLVFTNPAPFWPQLPTLPIYHLKMTWNPFNRRRTCLLFKTFENIRRVPQLSRGPYLKETQLE